eukprot:CAMPEP_0197180664 /NCGR_PEP_ID=MMETSP1423-20130617/5195_1 /TAXON_ID=476441 /ORGANISM="Pseudo-nitzschia heimii, Strain UNC1101" /LENGTH=351 /DNA_ID=CAMNT_0042630773 /DNA_START=104 /DNA_END=1159 /DNA_ORIENTATION=+
MAPVIIKPRELQLQDPNLPMLSTRKRKQDEFVTNGLNESVPSSTIAPSTNISQGCDMEKRRENSSMLKTYISGATMSTANKKARETRLEQNRKAARESRRRKKVMIEDLQRSVIFFSRANGALKHQNDELTRLFMQAQAQVSVIESTNAVNKKQTPATTSANASANDSHFRKDGQDQQFPASSSENESRPGVKASSNDGMAPATAATQVPPLPPPATNAPTYPPVAAMQPGATMQAMASFQQAAAAAMQVAVQGMQGISPGASMTTLGQPSVTTGSVSAQQAYNDTMTALAMQQAAIAASAVPSHLMAQIMSSTCNNGAWVPSQTPAPGAPVAPAAILPAASTQSTGTTPS